MQHFPADPPPGLCQADRERLGRIMHPRRRRAFLAGRHLLEMMVPGGLSFVEIDEGGKPGFSDPQLPAFSLSHSGDRVACAVAGEDEPDISAIGVDIEKVRERPRLLENAGHFLHPDEAEWISSCSDPEGTERFFQAWTIKEAVTKAAGIGLAGFRHFSVVPVGKDIPPRPGQNVCWKYQHWSLSGHWQLGLAWRGAMRCTIRPALLGSDSSVPNPLNENNFYSFTGSVYLS